MHPGAGRGHQTCCASLADPAFEAWGAPLWVADVAGFVLALIIVTFLHLVVGEMAPKSWAIAHPEKSATMLAIPMRAFMWLTRPLLADSTAPANGACARSASTPVDEVGAGQDPAALRHLVEHSATVGTLDERYHGHLISALELEALTVGDIVRPNARPEQRDTRASAFESRTPRRHRAPAPAGLRQRRVDGVVHVRDSLQAQPGDRGPPDAPGADPRRVDPVYTRCAPMRETRSHLAAVIDDGRVTGMITLNDVLDRLLRTADTAA